MSLPKEFSDTLRKYTISGHDLRVPEPEGTIQSYKATYDDIGSYLSNLNTAAHIKHVWFHIINSQANSACYCCNIPLIRLCYAISICITT